MRVQILHDPEPCWPRTDHVDGQIWPVLFQDQNQAPDIPGSRTTKPVTSGTHRVDRVHVVDQNDGVRGAVLLHVDEIPQGKLKMMQAVDEGEVQGLAAQLGNHIALLKKIVAGLREHALAGPGRLPQGRVRIDPSARFWPDDFEGVTLNEADQVGGWLQASWMRARIWK